MDQVKIGKFIADERKRKGFTQKQLSEKLDISDKTISKWECGNGFPEVSLLLPLCNELEITVNELLSGEKVSEKDYQKKAEENMVNLVKENNKTKSNLIQGIVNAIVGLLLAGMLCLLIYKTTAGRIASHYFFCDFLSLSIVIILPIVMLILAKQIRYFIMLFSLTLRKSEDKEVIRRTKNAASVAIKAELLSGGICTFIYLVQWLADETNVGYFGPNLANIVIGLFYSFVISAIILVLRERL